MDEIDSIGKFLFGVPLYVELALPADMKLKGILTGCYSAKADGYCSSCKKGTTYSIVRSLNIEKLPLISQVSHIESKNGFHELTGVCARHAHHTINYWFLLRKNSVAKVGQLPSLADIANDEAATYRSVLDKQDSGELHKAIGLAAHGVGIGSFVYLRRIFERLIQKRFDQFCAAEGWDADLFKKLRMNEKVDQLKDHLPSFLVENSKLYGVLSKGIHELSEEMCLAAFDPVKLSIKIILEDDKKKQDELELRKQAAAAIAKFEF